MAQNQKLKKPWYKSTEKGPLVVAWVQLAGVWVLAFFASFIPKSQQAGHDQLERIGDTVALISFVQFFTGVL